MAARCGAGEGFATLSVVHHARLWLPLLALAVAQPAAAGIAGPVLHEPIPPDAREDLAMHVALDGDLPAAIQTPSGALSAPDPRAPTSTTDRAYGAADTDRSTFQPDRDTKRPEIAQYDEPFTPSTAPFKRLEAYDAVRDDYQLYVRDGSLNPALTSAVPGDDDETFYADLVVDVAPDRPVRIPSVGPGTRIVRARVGVGAEELPFHVMHDGADNWYVQAAGGSPGVRARLVMELAIARAAFGGHMGDPAWSDLPMVSPLPDNVARDAAEVRDAIGVSRAQRPREAVARLVQYFRGFAEAEDPPRGRASVYLDLALSRKGVCRHRAFAFLVTAQSLGIPTRFIQNEAHAWVEIHDGVLWRRIDLGGAGHMSTPASQGLAERPVYKPPPDLFAMPQNAEPGDDMVADARARAASMGPGAAGPTGPGAPGSSSAEGGSGPPGPRSAPSGSSAASGSSGTSPTSGADHDDRPPSVVTLGAPDADAHRGLPLALRGEVRAEGEPCAHVAVELWLRDAGAPAPRMLRLGTLATGDDGHFAGAIVVPGSTPLGDYEVVARTPGDARCGAGGSN
jgi:transglutaminase-like putative cysteine protease